MARSAVPPSVRKYTEPFVSAADGAPAPEVIVGIDAGAVLAVGATPTPLNDHAPLLFCANVPIVHPFGLWPYLVFLTAWRRSKRVAMFMAFDLASS